MGDTVTEAARPAPALPGFEAIKPMVFAGIFPVLADEYEPLRDALGKLKLNDAAFFYEPENSVALGFGFRCGFLGLLHMEIVQERLEREFGLNLITTAPSVRYRITRVGGEVIEVDSPAKFPNPSDIEKIEEPIITAMIITNDESVGGILQLCQDKRGTQKNFEYLSPTRVMLTYELPLNEIVLDFYDRLKSVSRGYASLDYHLAGYVESDLIKLDVLVGGEPVDALALIIHREFSYERGRELGDSPAQTDSAPDVRSADSGGHRQPRDCPRNRCRHSQKRSRQVLWRRHFPQTQAPRKTKRRQKAHEARRPGRYPPGSLPRRPQSLSADEED